MTVAAFLEVCMIKFVRIISPILLVALMVTIFTLSHQPADVSSNTSSAVIRFLAEIFIKDFENLSNAEQLEIISSLQFIVRKGAHFSAYFVLGIFSFFTFLTYTFPKFHWRSIISLSVCFAFSVSDEIHQLFVPGRSGEIRDVLIDTCGSLLSIMILFLIFLAIEKKHNKKLFKGDIL